MIQVYNVSMSYKKDIEVLHEINFHVKKGEFVFLVGTSGAGKTTILRLLYRELVPTSGQIILAGKNLSQISRSQIPYLRRRMGVIFQDFKLLRIKQFKKTLRLP